MKKKVSENYEIKIDVDIFQIPQISLIFIVEKIQNLSPKEFPTDLYCVI